MLYEVLPLVLFPLMLMISGYMMSTEATKRARMVESLVYGFHIWHIALLVMVIHHLNTVEFVVFYPLILAILIHLIVVDNKAKVTIKKVMRGLVSVIAIISTIISGEWALCISILIVYLVIIIFENNDRLQELF